MRQERDHIQRFEDTQRAAAAISYALASTSRLHDVTDIGGTMRRRGWDRYVTKAIVSAVSATDTAVATASLRAAFSRAVEGQSAIGQIVGAVRMELTAAARLQATDVTASSHEEQAQKAVQRIDFTLANEPPVTVQATVVFSREALRAIDLETQSGITQLLVEACARSTDAVLVDALTTAAGSPASSSDPGTLLAAITGGNPSRPTLLGGYDALLTLDAGRLRDLRELGVRIIPTPAAAGQLVAFDASSLLIAADEGTRVETAEHASMVLDDGASPVSSTLVSLWQKNLIALRAERLMRFAIRSGAVSFASVGSPS